MLSPSSPQEMCLENDELTEFVAYINKSHQDFEILDGACWGNGIPSKAFQIALGLAFEAVNLFASYLGVSIVVVIGRMTQRNHRSRQDCRR